MKILKKEIYLLRFWAREIYVGALLILIKLWIKLSSKILEIPYLTNHQRLWYKSISRESVPPLKWITQIKTKSVLFSSLHMRTCEIQRQNFYWTPFFIWFWGVLCSSQTENIDCIICKNLNFTLNKCLGGD